MSNPNPQIPYEISGPRLQYNKDPKIGPAKIFVIYSTINLATLFKTHPSLGAMRLETETLL